MKKNIKEVFQNEEINLNDLFQLFKDKTKVLYIVIAVTVFLGMVKSCTTPVEYESTAVKLSEVETENKSMGQLGGLAGLAGINLGGLGGSGISNTFTPDMYPKLLESKPFLLDLINQEFYFNTMGKTMSIKEYYLEKRPNDLLNKTIDFVMGIPYQIIGLFSSSEEPIVVSADPLIEEDLDYIFIKPSENYVIEEIIKKIKIENKGRMIALSVKMPEPIIAAEFNNLVFKKILNYVSAYKIEKQKTNLKFIESSTLEAEEDFKKAQNNLASFRDANQGVISQRVKTKEDQLLAEFNLSFTVYSTLRQEFENSKIELKRQTPIFTTFEEAVVPNGPSNTSTIKVFFLSIFVGFFLGLMVIFLMLGRDYFKA
jgi:hypothetical protein